MKNFHEFSQLIGTAGAVAGASRPVNSGAWTADYLELREILAGSYANPDYAFAEQTERFQGTCHVVSDSGR